ncbi:Transcriptional regulator, AbiEi antitoxin, Type IV TA system [Pseudomonas frederiksbergensis]|uniref:Transcriptional regulator, AbiEi antitoxin, Type IV TA system n=1 Tax=Pseudomonas frederiksbergensis TaxID=104087 RepID=A0A1H5CN03_9PSED|nr:DUF6088 family protein [Pseudomonas frederiksbergensis]SED67997.1 Transcriptional regulator, AbiEi antitoxin, Type IV TA system [Pseudomonas frederiksbergensis]
MSVTANIVKRLKYTPKAQPFSINRFANLGSPGAVAKALSRLAASGELERLSRGIYMRPKLSHFTGYVRPSTKSVLGAIASHNREIIQVHGAQAVRYFGLSTQMQIRPVYYTSGASREVKVGAKRIRLLHVASQKLQHAGTIVGLALCALFYLGKNGVSDTVIASIKAKMAPSEFKKIADCEIPTWMQAALRHAISWPTQQAVAERRIRPHGDE